MQTLDFDRQFLCTLSIDRKKTKEKLSYFGINFIINSHSIFIHMKPPGVVFSRPTIGKAMELNYILTLVPIRCYLEGCMEIINSAKIKTGLCAFHLFFLMIYCM